MTAARPVLPRQQAAVLDSILVYIDAHGYPPSVREISDRIGTRSTSTVAHHLRALEFKGYIRRVHGHPRAIEVIDP